MKNVKKMIQEGLKRFTVITILGVFLMTSLIPVSAATKVSKIKWSAYRKTMYVGNAQRFAVKITPAKASKAKLGWKTSNILRIIMQCFLIILNRSIKFTLTNPCQTTNLISTHHKWIALDSCITVCFSTLKILQIQFSQCPEEIRFIQIRLSVNNLVKILNRKIRLLP